MREAEHPTPIAGEGPRQPEQQEAVPNGGLGRCKIGACSLPSGKTNSAKPLGLLSNLLQPMENDDRIMKYQIGRDFKDHHYIIIE